MSEDLNPAIRVFERRLEETERKAAELRNAINLLYHEAGQSPRFSEVELKGNAGNNGVPTQIKSDTFYGKKQQTAVREYLAMRKAQGLSTAKPREIYEALVAGGYKFEAKDSEIALVGLRSLLRKRTNVFHKLPNGTYGLLEWYPDAKAPKSESADPDEESADE